MGEWKEGSWWEEEEDWNWDLGFGFGLGRGMRLEEKGLGFEVERKWVSCIGLVGAAPAAGGATGHG